MRMAVLPLSLAVAVGLGTLALAGASDQSPRPKPRPAAVQSADLSADAAQSAKVQPAALQMESRTEVPASSAASLWDNAKYQRVWRAGDEIGKFNYHLLTRSSRVSLPPLPAGEAYVTLGTQVLRVNTQTWKVIDSVGQVNTILGRA